MKFLLFKIKLFFYKIFYKKHPLFYLCGGGALPVPLSTDMEKIMLERVSYGDKEAKNILIEHNLRLVIYIAKKFDNTGIDQDDLASIGTIGLIKAIDSFKIEKNIKLATYASRCIENEILMYLRRVSKKKFETSLDEPLNVDGEGNELLLSDILGTDPDIVYKNIESQVEVDLLYALFETLGEKEKYIVKMRFGLFDTNEMTQKEVADTLGISQSYISRLEKKIIYKLRREMLKKIYFS